ncbi:MAG: LysM peptidoglycan-binding domain-containing protein [Elusimicrobiota bacterium]|nr:LysM peptidoglycan-binding domain-containing protein [Elusimicrobiota bacterium]
MKKIIKIIILALLLVSSPAVKLFAQESDTDIRLLEIEVQPGDTLSKFARRYLNDPQKWPELLEYNNIPSGDPNLLLPGDVLRVPTKLVKDQIADIMYIKNNVRKRLAGAGAWEKAHTRERMYPEDGIRTAEDSAAKIQYLKGGKANIGENALVFLRPEERRENVVKLEVGELRAKDVKVLTDSASIDPEKDSEYTARVDEDKTTTLSVFKGRVDFISSGEKITIDEGYMSVAEFNKPPSKPLQLPDAPEIEDIPDRETQFEDGIPTDVITSETFSSSDLTQRLSAQTENKDAIRGVHVQVARDDDFTEMVVDREIKGATEENIKESLPDGQYWWRAAFVNKRGVRGKFSQPVKLRVSTHPPKLKILHPGDGQKIRTSIVTVGGVTEEYASVKVNGEKVSVDNNGNFVAGLNVKFGENTINIVATDLQGRTTEKTITIDGLPIEESKENKNTLVIVGVVASVISIAAILLAVMQ